MAAIQLMGCATDTGSGSLLGAAVGALTGQALGKDTKSTLIGAAIGGAAGAAVGNERDKARAQTRGNTQLPNGNRNFFAEKNGNPKPDRDKPQQRENVQSSTVKKATGKENAEDAAVSTKKSAIPKLPPFVKATGVGKDRDEALKNAFREAVRIAVGTVVDSEIIIKNDKLIKDEIIDYSRGFVESHKVLKEGKNSDGLHEMTIRATVKDRQLYEKLRRFQPASAKVEGSDIFGAVTSRMESRKKAAKLMARSLAATDLPLPLLKTEFLSKKPTILSENADSILAEWRVRVSFDQKLYQEKVYPWLRELLSDVATDKKLGQVLKAHGDPGRLGKAFSGLKYYVLEDGSDGLPKHWFARDKLVHLWKNWEEKRQTYDVFWVPSEVAVELEEYVRAYRKNVSGLVFELTDEKQNVLLEKESFFYGKVYSLSYIRDSGVPWSILPPTLLNSIARTSRVDLHTKIIPAFLFWDIRHMRTTHNVIGIKFMKDHIIVPWRIRVPLETIKKTKDVNCRIAP